jgi:hypothetical protein
MFFVFVPVSFPLMKHSSGGSPLFSTTPPCRDGLIIPFHLQYFDRANVIRSLEQLHIYVKRIFVVTLG